MKICSKCKIEKPLENYHKNGNRRRSYCKYCSSIYAKDPERKIRLREQWKKASEKYYSYDKRKVKTYKRYGLSIDQYNKLFEDQNGSCKICKENKKLFIDHNHLTGKIRGLLCLNCNSALGHLRENKKILQSAIEYLENCAP